MKRYRITRQRPFGGFGAAYITPIFESRVVEIAEGEPVPDGAIPVADDEPLTDWQEEKN